MRTSELGDYDALLAVATTDRAYAFLVPSGGAERQRKSGRQPAAQPDRTSTARRRLERCGGRRGQRTRCDAQFVGPGTAAGRARCASSSPSWSCWWSCATAPGDAAPPRWPRPGESTRRTPNALAAVPLEALDELSRSKVVEVDNAVRTSSNELALAIEEFGEERTEPFTQAVEQRQSRSVPSVHGASTTRRQYARDAGAAARAAHPGHRLGGRAPTANWNHRPRHSSNCGIW